TMLIFVSPSDTAVFFARIVIPFSRSRSIESMTRSATSWFSRNEPDCQSIASTSVVLPWSTWAMIATLRRSSRVCTARQGSVGGIAQGGDADGRLHDRQPDGARERCQGGRRDHRAADGPERARVGAPRAQPLPL